MSNALHHAFPEERVGEIRIRLFRTPAGEIEFHFSDNGIGVPEEFDFRAQNTLGLRTAFTIVEHQLQGNVLFEKQNGITCMIRFKDNLYTPRV